MAPETPRQRPDAVISKINQLSFGSSLGFGEAKIQRISKYELCHDLLRLALFSKESIDVNYLDGCMLFQIHGKAPMIWIPGTCLLITKLIIFRVWNQVLFDAIAARTSLHHD
jgi:hypothetical protein